MNSLLSLSVLQDLEQAQEVTTVVNEAYFAGEYGMWKNNEPRTTLQEVQTLIQENRIIVAMDGAKLLGTLKITKCSDDVLEFGQLAVARSALRTGAAKQLIAFVEAYARSHGYTTLKLEILYPSENFTDSLDSMIDMTDLTVPAWKKKALLDKIYTNLQFKRTLVGSMTEFAQDYPQLVNALAIPCNYVVYEKAL